MEYLSLLLSIVVVVSPLHGAVIVDSTPAVERRSYLNYTYYEITGDSDDISALLNRIYPNNTNNDNIMTSGATAEDYYFIVTPSYKQTFESFLQGTNLTKVIISNNYAAYVKSEQAPHGTPFSWTAYYDFPDIHKYLHNVSRKYRDHVKLVSAGFSYEKRPLSGVRINTGGAGKPAFMIECGVHAREWIAPASCTYFINQLLTSTDPQIVAMRDQFDWHIFPVINPDGYHYTHTTDRFWRKNRSKSPSGCHGVDLNRNWATDEWGVYSASNDSCNYLNYIGPAPFSEPETIALRSYISNITNLQAYVAVHSDFQEILFPFDCCDGHVSNYDDLKKIGNASIEYAYKVNGAEYNGPGPAGELDYKSSGESMDWVRKTFKTPVVFSIEMRGNYFDWPPAMISQQGDEFTQMILGMVTEAKNLGYFKTLSRD